MKKIIFLFLIVFLTIPFSFADSSFDDALNTTDNNIILDEDTYFKVQTDALEINHDLNLTGQGIDRTIVDGCQTQILSIKNVNVVISDLTFMNADFDSFGGAISNNGTLTLKNVKFINNTAYNCGAIDNMGKLTVENCIFINNSAYGRDAGAISNIGVATVSNSTFISNIAYRNAGAIKSQGEYMTVTDSIFIANRAIGDDSFGGAFYTWVSKSAIERCEFYDNYAANFGGALFCYGGQANWCELTVTQSNFVNNSAGDLGGIYVGKSQFFMNYSRIIDTPVSLIHNYDENISCNWWGENDPDWKAILTDSDYEPEVYAVLNVTNDFNQVYVNLYWNNTSHNAAIPNLYGSIDVIEGNVSSNTFKMEDGKYEFSVFNSSDDARVTVKVDNQNLTLDLNPLDKSIINSSDISMYYHDGSRYRVYLSDSKGNPIVGENVSITLNGVPYIRTTDKDGQASVALNLDSGEYIVKAFFNSTRYQESHAENTVSIKSTIDGNDVVKVFRNATQYDVILLDSKGNPLTGEKQVRFNINGVFYFRNVVDGKARLNLNLEQGNYVITATNLETGENIANNITILPKIINNNDVVKYYRNATQYYVQLVGDDGKVVGAGEEVKFNINGVFYTRMTNESGIAKLNLNLQPGEYVITAEYGGCRVANNITIKTVLSANDISMSYRDGTQFKATLLDGNGKAFSNQNVVFNINGVFYTRQTNGEGVASLNINLQAGKYIITSTFNELNIANTITIS